VAAGWVRAVWRGCVANLGEPGASKKQRTKRSAVKFGKTRREPQRVRGKRLQSEIGRELRMLSCSRVCLLD